jgi:NAD+ kinase
MENTMKRIALHYNEKKPGAAALKVLVAQRLEAVGLEAVYPADVAALQTCDALLVIGGDGTFLQSARRVLELGIPILGLNAGRLGFLAGLEPSELGLLEHLARDDFALDKRMLLLAQVWHNNAVVYESHCINDAVIARGNTTRLVELKVACGAGSFSCAGDGIIFSTPTGSTAYSLSAGGAVVEPQMESIILTPICNHMLFSRSVVFAPDGEFAVPIEREGLTLTCDSLDPYPLKTGEEIRITRSGMQASFIRLKQEHFLDTLRAKLVERR